MINVRYVHSPGSTSLSLLSLIDDVIYEANADWPRRRSGPGATLASFVKDRQLNFYLIPSNVVSLILDVNIHGLNVLIQIIVSLRESYGT